jgi:hypothetical protein
VEDAPGKVRKRLYACPHYVPPSKVCDKCDVGVVT